MGFLGSAGGTRHLYYLTDEVAKHVTRLNWIAQPFGIIALATGKLAVGFLLLRLIPPNTKWRRRIVWVLMSITMIANSISVILTFTQCRDVAALWDPTVHAVTQCWDPKIQSDFSTFTGSLNSAVDIIFSLIPITLIWKLHLSARKRFGLIVLLGSGIFSGVSAAIKTNQLVTLTARSDLTWETFGLYLWTGIEIFLIIVCGCVPTLRTLGTWFSGRQSTGRASGTRSSHCNPPPHLRDQEFMRLEDLPNSTQPTTKNKEPSDKLSTLIQVNRRYDNLDPLHDEDRLIQVTRSFQVEYSGNPPSRC